MRFSRKGYVWGWIEIIWILVMMTCLVLGVLLEPLFLIGFVTLYFLWMFGAIMGPPK